MDTGPLNRPLDPEIEARAARARQWIASYTLAHGNEPANAYALAFWLTGTPLVATEQDR